MMNTTMYGPANCSQLLRQIYMTSFAMDDVVLYLDTHPCDHDALCYYHYVTKLRNDAMTAYEAQCGPLMWDQVNCEDYWSWINDSWPWEGGNI